MCMSTEMSVVLTWICIASLLSTVDTATPQFTPPNCVDLKSEDSPIGTVLTTFQVTDGDPGDNIVVEAFNAKAKELVQINQTTGNDITVNVTLKSELDCDPPNSASVTLIFIATDTTGNEIRHSCILIITDVNDNSPVLDGQPYTWQIPESISGTTFQSETFTISARDSDSSSNFNTDSIKFSMRPNTQSDSLGQEYNETFSISSGSLVGVEMIATITTLKSLDYESNTYYQFTVFATDNFGAGNSVSADLIIRVLDVQDTEPFFTGIPYRTTLAENVANNTDVETVTAMDGDRGIANPVNYTLLNSPCSSLFDISTHNGKITTIGNLDRDSGPIEEEGGICILKVLVQEIEQNAPDQQYGKTNASVDVTVEITDENDNMPEFENATYTAEVQENTQPNVPITLLDPTQIMVFDHDQGTNARMTLTLHRPNSNMSVNSDFDVTPSTVSQSGSVVVRVKQSQVLDYEQIQQISLIIKATEEADVTHTATATLIINILDMNDNNPRFTEASYWFDMEENPSPGDVVDTVSATDADTGDFGNVTFALFGGNKRFVIDQYTGEIRTQCSDDCHTSFDFETLSVFYMTVTATDLGGRSNSTSLEVHLTDANDNTPEFVRQLSVFIQENDTSYDALTGSPLLKVEATDNDEAGTNNSAIVYSILESDNIPIDGFTLNETTGELFLTRPADYEEKMLAAANGVVKVVIEARDMGTPSLSSNTTVTITVQDMNDNSPVFNASMYTGYIAENATSTTSMSTAVGNVYAHDDDGTTMNSNVRYFVMSGTSGKFTIDQNTGEIQVQINALLDRETVSNYTATIIAIDQGSPPLTGTTTFVIYLTDVNDEMPVFDEDTYSVSVTENETSSVGEELVTCVATDPDIDHELFYSIIKTTGTDEEDNAVNTSLIQGYFDIHPSNGTVFVKSEQTLPDREVVERVVLTIQVSDQNAYDPSPQTATAMLTITLRDINDNSPEFIQQSYNVSVLENAGDNTILTTVRAVDRDVNRTITYGLLDSDWHIDAFTIGSDSGRLLKVGELDREQKDTVLLNVNATDDGVPPMTSYVSVVITVLDFNDNTPEFVGDTYKFNIPEDVNATVGLEVGQMNATDADDGPNSNVTFIIESGADGKFEIDKYSGVLSVIGSLNREDKSSYVLQIKARDNPIREVEHRSALKTVTIDIDDVNDNSPIFKQHQYTALVLENVYEDTNVDNSVATVSATDADQPNTNNSMIKYYFTNDTSPPGLFILDEQSGLVSISASLKGLANVYTLGLMARDQGEPQLAVKDAVITITVQDVNLNKPVVTNLPINNTIKVYECVSPSYEVYMFNYTDDDQGVNAEGNFSMSSLTDDSDVLAMFDLGKDGSLKTLSDLDANSVSKYSFQLSVTDKGTPALSSDLHTIHIEVVDVNDHLPYFEEAEVQFSVKEQYIGHVATVTAVDDDMDSISCYHLKNTPYNFTIGLTDGNIELNAELDYEVVKTITLEVTVSDCSLGENISSACGDTVVSSTSQRPMQTVLLSVIDTNDNPPRFITREITVGMRRVTEVGAALQLSLKDAVVDADTLPENTGLSWVFTQTGNVEPSPSLQGSLLPLTGVEACRDGEKHIVCVTGNGSVVNNKYFSEDITGYFKVPVNVSDPAGSDSADVKIYLIGDSQISKMVIFDRKENVATYRDRLLSLYGNITGYTFVYGWMEDHKTDAGELETIKTDLYFHVVDPVTQQVLSSEEVLQLVDEHANSLLAAMNEYKVLAIYESVRGTEDGDSSSRTIYILVAIIVVLTLTVAIIIYVSMTTRNKYKRKLQAATIRTQDYDEIKDSKGEHVPGSNQYAKYANPLLNAEVPDNKDVHDTASLSSQSSIDSAVVGEMRSSPVYDRMEEKEMSMDLYNEDTLVTSPGESVLDAALRMHDMSNLRNRPDTVSTDCIVSPDDVHANSFINHSYNSEMECTEI